MIVAVIKWLDARTPYTASLKKNPIAEKVRSVHKTWYHFLYFLIAHTTHPSPTPRRIPPKKAKTLNSEIDIALKANIKFDAHERTPKTIILGFSSSISETIIASLISISASPKNTSRGSEFVSEFRFDEISASPKQDKIVKPLTSNPL